MATMTLFRMSILLHRFVVHVIIMATSILASIFDVDVVHLLQLRFRN